MEDIEKETQEFFEEIRKLNSEAIFLGFLEDINQEGLAYDKALLFVGKKGPITIDIPPMYGWEYKEFNRITEELWGEEIPSSFSEDELILNWYLNLYHDEKEVIKYQVILTIRPDCCLEKDVRLSDEDKNRFISLIKERLKWK